MTNDDVNVAVLGMYNKLHKIYDPIEKAIRYCYADRSLYSNYDTVLNDLNNNTLKALALAKEKIIELENEINNEHSA